MNTFVINGDFLSADFGNRFNLFALTWGGQIIVDRVMLEKMKRHGYTPPVKPSAEWTAPEIALYREASIASDDGQTPPFDFIEMYDKVAVPITINQSSKTFVVNGTSYSFDGMICDVVINVDRTVTARSYAKVPGQLTNAMPLGSYLLAQLYYDRSGDELYVVSFKRFQYQRVFNPTITTASAQDVRTIDIGISSPTDVLPLLERLITKRWALMSSADYSTSIEQTRGLPSNQWLVLEAATFLSVPTKPKVVKFFLSRFFSKFDYAFSLNDFVIAQAVGCSVAESPDGAMAVTITGQGVLEVVPKSPSRIFIAEDVIRTSDLHLRLTVI